MFRVQGLGFRVGGSYGQAALHKLKSKAGMDKKDLQSRKLAWNPKNAPCESPDGLHANLKLSPPTNPQPSTLNHPFTILGDNRSSL